MDAMGITRGGDTTKNFAVGEPVSLGAIIHACIGTSNQWSPRYPLLGGDQQLIDAILESPWQNGKHVVITNGATQGLGAAFYALKQVGGIDIYFPTPYWPRFPGLTTLAGFDTRWKNIYQSNDHAAICIASPNNPDGSQLGHSTQNQSPVDIWDAAYACLAYGWNGFKPTARITVHSVSKLLGLSGLRIGWISTDDENLAQLATNYVEITTSGVGAISQAYIAKAINRFNHNPEELRVCHMNLRNKILMNYDIFQNTIGAHCENTYTDEITGMFAWFKPINETMFIETARNHEILYVEGKACGMPGWKRMTLANDLIDTERCFKTLAKGM